MKHIIRKIERHSNKFFQALKHLEQVYKYGGYTTANISYLDYGKSLKGKNILITGGGSGIGLSIAKKCIKEGARVLITGRNAEKLNDAKQKMNDEQFLTLQWDISKISQMDKKIEEAENILGSSIDALVNNAGILSAQYFEETTEEEWDKVYSINSKGLFFITQKLCIRWSKQKENRTKKIINITSQGGFVGATYPYRLTKWDVNGLTQGLGLKYASQGIIINGIAPGIVATDMQQSCLNQAENLFILGNPINRFALPEEIAELASFLMTDAANFIVGQTIVCDGGYSLK